LANAISAVDGCAVTAAATERTVIGAALAPVGEAISESDGKATRIAGVSRRRQDVVVVCFFVMVYLAF